MADNITIPGTGSVVAADDISSVYYQRVKLAVGADGLAADQATCTVSSNFNRPANTTAYSINDNVSDNVTAGSVTVSSFVVSASIGIIRRVRVRKSDQTVSTPTIRVWFFESSPTVGSGDNAAFSHPLAASVGYVDVDVVNAGTDDAVGWANTDIPVVAGTCYALLQTLTVFTPASAETFTTTIWYLNG